MADSTCTIESDLAASNEGLVGLGLQPTTLKGGLLEEVTDIARRYAERCDRTRIPCMSHWTTDIAGDIEVIVPSGEASTAG